MTYPATVKPKILINGNDYSSHVWISLSDIVIESILTRQVDKCNFIMGDVYGLSPAFKEWDEVVITDENAGSVRLFGGYVQQIDYLLTPTGNRLDATVRCADYTCLLDHVIVKRQWLTPTADSQIIADMFSAYLPEIDYTTFVATVTTIEKLRLNRLTLRNCMDLVAQMSGADWYVDYDKKLHFFNVENNPAPYALADSPDLVTTYPYFNMKVNKDGTGVINRVEVVGGYYLSDDQTFYIAGNGVDTKLSLQFRTSAPVGQPSILVWRNDGTYAVPVWTPMTVLVGYIDTLTANDQVLDYYQERVLEQLNPWPNLPNAVKITGRYSIPLLTRFTDDGSFQYYGRYFDAVITDADIVDKQTARLRALGLMAQSALSLTAVSCDIYQPGLRAGMNLGITNVAEGVNGLFYTQKVSTRIKTGGYIVSSLDTGVYRPDLLDLIIWTARNAKSTASWRDDEVLEEVIQVNDNLILAEAFSMSTSNGPYKWGPSAGALKWSFGKWG